MKTKLKTMVLFLLFITISNFSYSQPIGALDVLPSYIRKFTSVGDISFIIKYDLKKYRFPKGHKLYIEKDTIPSKFINDIQVLEIANNGISKTYSRKLYEADSTVNTYGMKEFPSINYRNANRTVPIEVYKNYPQGKYTVTQRVLQDVLMYKEPYPINFNWQLTNDKKTIHSYECQKATTTFRGRTYEAWFAVDIPISDGPYKFGGLPGLILELRDSEDHYVYNCIGIKQCKTVMPIKFWDWKYKKMTKEKHDKLVRNIHKNTGLYMIANAGERSVSAHKFDKATRKYIENGLSKLSTFYNPIELE